MIHERRGSSTRRRVTLAAASAELEDRDRLAREGRQSMGRTVFIDADSVRLEGELAIPRAAKGIVLFAHGSGSSRHSPRNRLVAEEFNRVQIGTLLFDLLTAEEAEDHRNVFDIDFLAHRLRAATRWLRQDVESRDYPLAYFGASTGAAAALIAAAQDKTIAAVVSRGGRPDLAIRYLADVQSPTLLIVGGSDFGVIELNEKAYGLLRCEKSLKVVPGATHLFEEPGALEKVAAMSADWFLRHLGAGEASAQPAGDPFIYEDRATAGRMLAKRLNSYAGSNPVVLGIARGGMPVAKEVASALAAPLDVIIVRKLGAPDQLELGIGAVVDGDHPRAIFNQELIDRLGVSDRYLESEIARQLAEVKRREADYRGGRATIPLAGRTVILVDDGIATGSSVRAALRGVRRHNPKRLVLGIPVAPAESLEALRSDADEIVCLQTPEDFFAVGQFYRDFGQVSDDEVKSILSQESSAALRAS